MKVETMDVMQKEKLKCPDCGEKMYQLQDSVTSTYVCPECGCCIDAGDKNINTGDIRPNSNDNDMRISIEKLFDSNFMKKYTNYDNFTDFMIDSELIPKNISLVTYDLFETIPDKKLDEYIKTNTIFNSWKDMFDKATSRYLKF